MIVALLFLILFAILFPKALRFLFALLFIGMIVALGSAHAGYDCHDGKFDDCTAQWSRDHGPPDTVPLCIKWPCENGDTPVADDSSTHRCRKIKKGDDVSIDEIDRLAPILKGKVYSSDCAVRELHRRRVQDTPGNIGCTSNQFSFA